MTKSSEDVRHDDVGEQQPDVRPIIEDNQCCRRVVRVQRRISKLKTFVVLPDRQRAPCISGGALHYLQCT